MRHLVVIVLVLIVTVVAYQQGRQSVAAPAQTTTTEKWLVVESRYDNGNLQENAIRWLVSPDGSWLIIPEAHKSWASQLKEGQETDLPKFVNEWQRAVFPEERETDDLRTIGLVKVGQHTYLAAKFFFRS